MGVLEDGHMIQYNAPVMEGPGADCPPPLGLRSQQKSNATIATREMLMIFLPQDFNVRRINWPEGTRIYQCEKGARGHMSLQMSHTDKRGKPPKNTQKAAEHWLTDKQKPTSQQTS